MLKELLVKTTSVAAGSLAAVRSSPSEVPMPFSIEERAPHHTRPKETITIRRNGEPDLQFEGWLLFRVKYEPATLTVPVRRWKHFALYSTKDPQLFLQGQGLTFERLVVAQEGHSNAPNERTLCSAVICWDAAAAWIAMGKIDDLKDVFREYGLPVVKGLDD